MQRPCPKMVPDDVVVCRCGRHGKVPPGRADAVARRLQELGTCVRVFEDLCAACARQEPQLLEWVRHAQPRWVAACRPRAIRAMFQTFHLPTEHLVVVDLTVPDAESSLASRFAGYVPSHVGTIPFEPRSGLTPATDTRESECPEEPLAWFPVIDYERCTACGLCVEFCLFGVYERKDRTVTVVAPWNCKPHCPACARICPTAAIVFPKYHEPPYDGSEITDETAARARAQAARHELLGKDLKEALRQRRASVAGTARPSVGFESDDRASKLPEYGSSESNP